LLTAPDSEVMRIVGTWYVADRNPRWVRRNALIVLGNSGIAGGSAAHAQDVALVLARYLHGDDDLLREHATWAAHKLGRRDLLVD